MLKKILSARTNVIGTALVAAGSSLLTLLVVDGIGLIDRPSSAASSIPMTATASVLECEQDVYSPVQRKCVSKQVFDEEMKRLFAALGIDASIYSPDTENN